MGLFERLSRRVAESAIARLEAQARASGVIGAAETVICMAEAIHLGGPREWGRVWILTDKQTVVWLPRERRAVVAVGHGDLQYVAGGNWDSGSYVAYVVDMSTGQNVAFDQFLSVPQEFALILDDMRVTGGPYRRAGSATSPSARNTAGVNEHIGAMAPEQAWLRSQSIFAADESLVARAKEIEREPDGTLRDRVWYVSDRAFCIVDSTYRNVYRYELSDPTWTIGMRTKPGRTAIVISRASQMLYVGIFDNAAMDDWFQGIIARHHAQRPEIV